MGVVATSDPATKLSDAYQLFTQQDRPLIAERLIREAIVIYEERNDELGLADAYRYYGMFFNSSSVAGHGGYYRHNGFLDKTASFDGRHDKSIEYFQKAGAIYRERKQFDALTNLSLNMGLTYIEMGKFKAACQAFDESAEHYRKNVEQNPAAKPFVPKPFASYHDYMSTIRKRYGCPYL
jgi:tetratricopeptide (TPR) repeat protein